MKSHCFPFRQVPHTSKLFLDYLDFSPSVQPFYPRSPRFLEWAKEESGRIRYPADRRERVTTILERQNRAWGASATTLQNIDRLRSGACAIVTGQQVGLFGGPVFSIYKALSAVKLARRIAQGRNRCCSDFLAGYRGPRFRRSESGSNAGRRRQARNSGQRLKANLMRRSEPSASVRRSRRSSPVPRNFWAIPK